MESYEIAIAKLGWRRRLVYAQIGGAVAEFGLYVMAQRGNDKFFNVGRRDAADAAGIGLALLQQRLRDIVAVAYALLVGVARAMRLPRSSKMSPQRKEGERERHSVRVTARSASFACTASNSSLSMMGVCSPACTSPR